MIDARSLVIGRIIEAFTSLPDRDYQHLRIFINSMCEQLKCEDLTDEEWKFVLEYCKQMDRQLIDRQLRRYPLL